MKTADIMTRNLAWLPPDASIKEAWELMGSLKVRHCPVVAGSRLLGIISDRDVLPYTRDGRVVEVRNIEEIMTEVVVTATRTTPVGEIARRMRHLAIDAIPILENERVIGIVTSSDLLALLEDADDKVLDELALDFDLTLGGVNITKR